jgi:hypothetical protein
LRCVRFAVESRFRYIGEKVCACCCIDGKVIFLENFRQIDPSAFGLPLGEIATWDGPPELAFKACFLGWADSRTLFCAFSEKRTVVIPAKTEVIGSSASRFEIYKDIRLSRKTIWREVSERAFLNRMSLEAFTLPVSVRKIGNRCFGYYD